MIFNINLIRFISCISALFFCSNLFSQEIPSIKHLDEETLDEVKIDIDNDGDLDVIVAGVFVKKNQGRVYLLINSGLKYDKPEFIYSFPSIGMKQTIEVVKEGSTTTVSTMGTSPTGKQDKYTATLFNGTFEGLTIPPISSDTID